MFRLIVDPVSIITLHLLLNNASLVIYENNVAPHCLLYEKSIGDICAAPFFRASPNGTLMFFVTPYQWRCGPAKHDKILVKVSVSYKGSSRRDDHYYLVDSRLSRPECDRKELVTVTRHAYDFFSLAAVHVVAPLVLFYGIVLAIMYAKRLMWISVST
jgi:hypothetical protein